jgi:hypothetical protein
MPNVPDYRLGMRRAGLWLVAVCVGFTASMTVSRLVLLSFDRITGPFAVVYVFSLPLVFGFTTAWVVTWLEAISRPAARSRFRSRAH